MPGAAEREVTIELSEGEYVAERGKRAITWLVRLKDAWVHISQWPGATSERLDAKSGTVWESRTTLLVPAGTRLKRIESRPAPDEKRTALEYLSRPPGTARRVFRHEYRVGRRGQLLRQG